MNNKKGFTLVEIIAVIALIGVIMVLVVPNVVNTFEQAKKSAFITQGQRVIKSMNNVLSDYLADGMPINNDLFFVDDETKENLKMPSSFGDRLRADNINSINYIGIFVNGKLVIFGIADDNYCYTETRNPNVTDIGKGIKNIDETKVVTSGKLGINSEEGILYCTTDSGENVTNIQTGGNNSAATIESGYIYWKNEEVSSSQMPSAYQTTYDSSVNQTLIRTTINNYTVTKHEACLVYNNKLLCIDSSLWNGNATSSKAALKSKIESTLNLSNVQCDSRDENAYCQIGSYSCSVDSERAYCNSEIVNCKMEGSEVTNIDAYNGTRNMCL